MNTVNVIWFANAEIHSVQELSAFADDKVGNGFDTLEKALDGICALEARYRTKG
jgi:hypothetical protein